ncbi:MAG: hypothetical protein ACRD1E_04690, partial [Terriglobales bacterium]
MNSALAKFVAAAALACLPLAAQSGIRTSVVVDSNPALFAVLAGLNAAGYDRGLPAPPHPPAVSDQLRLRVRQAIQARKPAVVAELRGFYQAHHLNDPNQDLAQYVT